MFGVNSQDKFEDEKLFLRRANSEDIEDIYKLIQQDLTLIFGRVRILNLIEKSLLSFTITKDDNQIVAFGCFSNHPNFSKECDEEMNWLTWLHSNFEVEDSVNNSNSLFIWYFAADEVYSVDAARLLMREYYNFVPYAQNCFLICPEGVSLNEALITVFYPLPKKIGFNKSWRGFVGNREHHNQPLHVREARVEDNDDLIPLFDGMSDCLRQHHGEYFVAEYVKNQTEHKKCLVAEVEGVAVGFMSINSDFGLDALSDHYDLDPFNGLRDPHADDVILNVWESEVEVGRDEDEEESEGKEDVEVGESEGGGSEGGAREVEQTEEEEEEEVEDREDGEDGEKVASDATELTTVPDIDCSKGDDNKPALLQTLNTYLSNFTTQMASPIGKKASAITIDSYKFEESSGGNDPSNDQGSIDADRITESQKDLEMSLTKAEKLRMFGASLMESSGHLVKAESNRFCGEASCVCVELYAINDKFATRAGAFLLKIFETFPNKTYCLINLPHVAPEPPLLKYFTRVTPLMKQNQPNVLYVFASPGVLDDILVRKATLDDLAGVKRLLGGIRDGMEVLKDVDRVLEYEFDEERAEMTCYVADLEGQIVGLAILKREEDIEYIRSHYNIEHFVDYHQHKRVHYKHLVHFFMNPAFNHFNTFFLQELLSQSRTSNLCYYYQPSYLLKDFKAIATDSSQTLRSKNSVSPVIDVLMPVSARRQIVYNLQRLEDNSPSHKVTQEKDPFHLMFISSKNILNPRISINARIVVVGASDTAIAFLQTLVYNPRLKFTNVTLISTYGLPGDVHDCKFRPLLLSHNHCYGHRDYAEMGLRVWVNVVVGKMTSLDRKDKVITVDSSRFFQYDYLFLLTGNQYIISCPPSINPQTGEFDQTSKTAPRNIIEAVLPKTVFVVNGEKEAAVFLRYVHRSINHGDKLVVHGNSLDAYCCLHGLINSGINPQKIIFALPPVEQNMTCLNNLEIDCDVIKNLKAIKALKVLRDVKLEGWKMSPSTQDMYAVMFSTNRGSDIIKIRCKALILYTHKGVDFNAFHAINSSTLVFDRRLVIDANFRTNDASIWSAGPLTKYQRSYYSDDYNHSICNSKEIGYSLANSVMYLFNAFKLEAPPTSQSIKLTPTYQWPKIRAGVLPGNYNYLHVHKPDVETPLKLEEKEAQYGHILRSRMGSEETQGYFRLHINNIGFVQTITCYSKKDIPSANFICLYGLHHKFLNNILGRWYEGLVKDLYVFLSEPWSNLLYHDRFVGLKEGIREIVMNQYNVQDGHKEPLDQFIRGCLDENLEFEDRNGAKMRAIFQANHHDKHIQKTLSYYLTDNHNHLPMFVKPF